MGVASDILSHQSAMAVNQANREYGRRSTAVNQMNLNTMMQREDDAVQRRAADMEAAGINPLLAAGNPAASGGMTTATGSAGNATGNWGGTDILGRVGGLTATIQDARLKEQQLDTERAKTTNVQADTISKHQNVKNQKSQKEQIDLETQMKNWDYQKSQMTGTKTGGAESMPGKMYNDFILGLDKAVKSGAMTAQQAANAYNNGIKQWQKDMNKTKFGKWFNGLFK